MRVVNRAALVFVMQAIWEHWSRESHAIRMRSRIGALARGGGIFPADRAMLFGNLLCRFVVVRGNDDHRVEMRMIEAEGYVEQIIKTDAGGDRFEAERLGSAEREIT